MAIRSTNLPFMAPLPMTQEGVLSRVQFFDERADRWGEDRARVESLREGLARLGIGPSEAILDVGCGTGTLVSCLLDLLGPSGRVHAIDISPRMIAKASSMVADPRVSFALTSADRLLLPSSSVNRIFCLSCWPHLDDPEACLDEFARVLRPAGRLHIWHLVGRDTVNMIHRRAGGAVGNDTLEPAEDLARLLDTRGFEVYELVDVPQACPISAVRRGGPRW